MKNHLYALFIAIIGIGCSILGYLYLPDRVPVHWNINGTIDRYGSKLESVIIFPIVIIIVYLLLILLPKVDPRKDNYKQFKDSYYIIINSILTFLLIIHGMTIAAGMGINVNISIFIPVLIGVLFIIIGNYTQRIESNFFIGIRTPWALQDEAVWKDTNRFGGQMFIIGGLLLMIAAFVPPLYKIILFSIAIIVSVVVPIIYSYFRYKKLHP